ncbi:hypothetical protein DIPPA_18610 [Diplonema papillatum]|nr:hypothetical protein DIPPA_18610 [Diplonema papillatum]
MVVVKEERKKQARKIPKKGGTKKAKGETEETDDTSSEATGLLVAIIGVPHLSTQQACPPAPHPREQQPPRKPAERTDTRYGRLHYVVRV